MPLLEAIRDGLGDDVAVDIPLMDGDDDACAALEAVENVPVGSGLVSRDRLSGLVVCRKQRQRHRQQQEQERPTLRLEVGGWFDARWLRQLFADLQRSLLLGFPATSRGRHRLSERKQRGFL